MISIYSKNIVSFLLFLILVVAATKKSACQDLSQKEFRGVWIATINNIDWPSAPGLTVTHQKRELEELIDRIDKFNLNAVFFQVRPAADAFYASETEPWSYFLTGKQGKPSEPFFDPLAYAIERCHSRGIELHAWFNPFRVMNNGKYDLAKNSFAAKNPHFQHEYDNKKFFDPGFPQVRSHIIKVIMEVVSKYDIDGVLLDDYFYPYPIAGKRYPDSKTFAKYGKDFYPKLLKDWRRNNIDCFIADLHNSIKEVKPGLRLGISPFGVWRSKSEDPKGSPLPRGTTSYDDLYADVQKWLSMDWIDYVIPQLYWEQGNKYGDFATLARWWNDHSYGKPLYLGQALYRSTDSNKGWNNPKEISDQLSIMREFENVRGFALFSASHLSMLPEIEMSGLTALLAKPKIESQASQNVSLENIIHPPTVKSTSDLIVDDDLFETPITIINTKQDINPLPVQGEFGLRKHRQEWLITWHPSDTLQREGQKFVLLIYELKDGKGHLKKVSALDESKRVIIPKDLNINPRKALYAFVSIDQGTKSRCVSNLFRIKRNKIVYN